MRNRIEYRIQAEFIVVDPKSILSNAQMLIRDGRIVELCETPTLQPDLHLPKATLLPGFINCHTHLEFSDLATPFPANQNFPNWIASIVSHRRKQADSLEGNQLAIQRHRTILKGHAECRQWGTAAVVDIATEPWSAIPLVTAHSGESIEQCYPQLIVLAELLGVDQQRFRQTLQWADSLLLSQQPPIVIEVGLSPHAPYSLIHPEAFVQLKEFHSQALTAMHVAESLEEREWLATGNGPFRELYERIGLPTNKPRMQIGEAIQLLANRPRSLLVHGNYLTEAEMAQCAAADIAIVYCPRTHQHFGHSSYPLKSMREHSIPVVLGTDSRASNPDLSVWRECCTARQLHSSVWSAEDALAAITDSAARILGIQNDLGSLQPGRRAIFNSVPTPDGATAQTLLDRMVRLSSPHPLPLNYTAND